MTYTWNRNEKMKRSGVGFFPFEGWSHDFGPPKAEMLCFKNMLEPYWFFVFTVFVFRYTHASG
jgi:hypothetical protein